MEETFRHNAKESESLKRNKTQLDNGIAITTPGYYHYVPFSINFNDIRSTLSLSLAFLGIGGGS